MKILTIKNSVQRMADSLLEEIYDSQRVERKDYAQLEQWRKDLMQVLARLGEEFQEVFLKELRRQVMRKGGRPADIKDRIVANTIVAMVDGIDPIMHYRRHPAIELLRSQTRNVLVPFGNVLYRAVKFVARRNRNSVTVQMTTGLSAREMERAVDKLDDIIEEELYAG